mgnify:CR=1 FL=1
MGLGELGEDFAVKVNVGFFEAGDEAIIGNAVKSGGGADLDLPEAAEIPFLFAPVGELKTPGMKQGLLGLAVVRLPGPHKTLAVLEQVLAALMSDSSSFNPGHCLTKA